MSALNQPAKCPQCGALIATPHTTTITDLAFDEVKRKKYVRRRKLTFCSPTCGGHYQMGCEG